MQSLQTEMTAVCTMPSHSVSFLPPKLTPTQKTISLKREDLPFWIRNAHIWALTDLEPHALAASEGCLQLGTCGQFI